jgi:hypothetical protein
MCKIINLQKKFLLADKLLYRPRIIYMCAGMHTGWLNVQNSAEKGVPWEKPIFYRFVQVGFLVAFRPSRLRRKSCETLIFHRECCMMVGSIEGPSGTSPPLFSYLAYL